MRACRECDNENINSVSEKSASNIQHNAERNEVNNGNERQTHNNSRRRVIDIRWKCKINKIKDKVVVLLFAVNCNGLAPRASGETEEIEEENKARSTDVVMIILSDTRWETCNKNTMMNRLKNVSSNAIMNASDSGEEVEDGKSFLKGGALTALWN